MKKVLFSALLLLAVGEVWAQNHGAYYSVPAKIRYPNTNTSASTAAAPDSIKNDTVDTLKISIMGGGIGPEGGQLFPVGVMIYVTTTDADVSATPDTLAVTYDVGLRNKYAAIEANTALNELTAVGTYTRTILFAAPHDTVSAHGIQLTTAPWGEEIRMRLANPAGGATDTLGYRVDARVIYVKP